LHTVFNNSRTRPRIDYSEYYLGKEEGNQLTESESYRSTWSKKALVKVVVNSVYVYGFEWRTMSGACFQFNKLLDKYKLKNKIK